MYHYVCRIIASNKRRATHAFFGAPNRLTAKPQTMTLYITHFIHTASDPYEEYSGTFAACTHVLLSHFFVARIQQKILALKLFPTEKSCWSQHTHTKTSRKTAIDVFETCCLLSMIHKHKHISKWLIKISARAQMNDAHGLVVSQSYAFLFHRMYI